MNRIIIIIGKSRPFLVLLFASLLDISVPTLGQNRQSDLEKEITFDAQIKVGRLKNGLTYFLRRNDSPAKHISMHLVVNAGFEHQDEDQEDIAHVMEHMVFLGTTHFANAPVHFSKYGLRFGDEITASTRFEQTTFDFEIPSGDSLLFNEALLFLRDCANGTLFGPDKVENERGPLLREFYLRAGYIYPMKNDYLFYSTGNPRFKSKYERTEQNIKEFKIDVLKRFYNDWYRPELQAVIVVGDIEVEDVEQKMKTLFSDLIRPVNERVLDRELFLALSDKISNNLITFTHRDFPYVEFRMHMKHSLKEIRKWGDYKEVIVGALYSSMMNSRRAQSRDADRLVGVDISHYFWDRCYVPGEDYSEVETSVRIRSDEIKHGFQAAVRELEQVRRYGFSEEELISAKEEVLSSGITQLNNSSSGLSSILVAHFGYGSPVPSPEDYKTIMYDMVKNTSVHDVNETVKDWVNTCYSDILLCAPSGYKNKLPNEDDVSKWISEVKRSEVVPYELKLGQSSLMSQADVEKLKENVTQRKMTIVDIDAQKLEFSNGVTVILKPVREESRGTISVVGFSSFRPRRYDDKKASAAEHLFSEISKYVMPGTICSEDLNKLRSAKRIYYDFFLDKNFYGVRGAVPTRYADVLMQLIFLYFTMPQVDSTRCLDSIEHLSNSNLIEIDEMFDTFKQHFDNANGFTFVVAGQFDEDKMVSLAKMYFGNLPSSVIRKKAVKNGTFAVPDIAEGMDGNMPRAADASVNLIYKSNFKGSRDNVKLECLQECLHLILFNRLREVEGGVFDVRVTGMYSNHNQPSYRVSIWFECDPKDSDRMIRYVEEEIRKLRKLGPDSVLLARVKEIEGGIIDRNLQTQRFWVDYLSNQIQEGRPLNEILRRTSELSQLNRKDVRHLARKYLAKSKAIRMVQIAREVKAGV